MCYCSNRDIVTFFHILHLRIDANHRCRWIAVYALIQVWIHALCLLIDLVSLPASIDGWGIRLPDEGVSKVPDTPSFWLHVLCCLFGLIFMLQF